MSRTRVELAIIGQVVLSAGRGGLQTAEAIGIGGGRVLLAGEAATVLDAAPGARVLRFDDAAVVAGLHDFHLHLVGMARQRREVNLEGLGGADLAAAVTAAAERQPGASWLRGRGWTEAAMDAETVAALNVRLADRPALLYSHDAHSAWASPAALRHAEIGAGQGDPQGGRIERDAAGRPTGVLRESATDLVESVAERLRGEALERALDEVLAELAALGVTGATDAGDTAPENGMGGYAALGDRASLLLAAANRLEGRLRLAVGFPAGAIAAAGGLGLRTGANLPGLETVRAGWAKAYADGALGSRTAALFAPYTCPPFDSGILRLEPDHLAELLDTAEAAGIGLAVHAIGDRAVAAVLDALERRSPATRQGAGRPPDRIEHLQLLRAGDHARLARLDVTASVQPVHCAADREHVERCWADRAELAYPWRSLGDAGARLAFGSDAPIETPNPWVGMFAAVHRRHPGDGTPDWQSREGLNPAEALAGYTSGPAAAAGRHEEGNLHPGAVADLAVLDIGLDVLRAADERLAAARSVLTLVAGREVHRA